jgi:predicted RNase H-like HicB family nuclease
VRCIVFQEGDVWYGVALEFNIVESGDDPDVVLFNLNEAIQGYVESQQKVGGSRVAPLNQKADIEYEDLWNSLISDQPIPSPITVKHFGYTNVASQ